MIGQFRERILAADARRPLRIRGGGSKDFYGGPLAGEVLDTTAHAGIVSYEPTELVVTVRCGTRLADLDAALAEHRQFLACEPPSFGGAATVGGALAAGLSGPRRAAVGAFRDFVLGVTMLDGEGRELRFGGQVMKNVAGYDVSRLMAGSLGTLGLILDVSLKVMPRPTAEATVCFELAEAEALARLNAWAGQPIPVSASCWCDRRLYVRLSGAGAAVAESMRTLGGEPVPEAEARGFWQDVREHRHRFFGGDEPLWRLSLPSVARLAAPAPLIEWGGSLRWYRGGSAEEWRQRAVAVGGHASLFRGGDRAAGVFPRPPAPLLQLQQRVQHVFDPRGVFASERLYPLLAGG